jgi:hypothetical protein
VGYPGGIAFDSAGDLFFADSGNNRVEEIPATSKTQWNIPMTIDHEYTVAGNAEDTAGSSGDGGVATAVYLSGPKSIAFDSAGDLYIADSGNNRVQEVAAAAGAQWKNGTITACGIGHFPSRDFKINAAWPSVSLIAATLLSWLRLPALDGQLARAEPKALLYRVLHTAARLVRGGRQRRLQIPASWPWADAIVTARARISALPQAP